MLGKTPLCGSQRGDEMLEMQETGDKGHDKKSLYEVQ